MTHDTTRPDVEAAPWKRGDKAVLEVEVWSADANGFGAWVMFEGLDSDRQDRQTFWYPQSSLVRPIDITTLESRLAAQDEVVEAARESQRDDASWPERARLAKALAHLDQREDVGK